MTHRFALIVTSALSAALFGLHWADEITRGMEVGTMSAFGGIVILVVWLSGSVVLGHRRSGYIVMLIGGILGLGVLILHMQGAGMVGRRIVESGRILFWVITLIALGVSSSLSGILAAQGLWGSRQMRGASQ